MSRNTCGNGSISYLRAGMLVLSINLLYIIHTKLRALAELFIQRCNYAFVISRIISRLAADD